MSLFRITLGGLGLVALSSCFVACGDDDTSSGDKDGGETGGSSSTGGKSGSGGSDEAGAGGSNSTGGKAVGGDASTDDGGTGGSGDGGPSTDGGGGDGAVGDGGGIALVKFCNDVGFGTPQDPQPVTFVLVIGEGAARTEIEVTTGECTPAINVPCTQVAAGTDVQVDLFDKDNLNVALDGISFDFAHAASYIFNVVLDGTPVGPKIDLWANDDNLACSSVSYDDVYPPTNTLSTQSVKRGYFKLH